MALSARASVLQRWVTAESQRALNLCAFIALLSLQVVRLVLQKTPQFEDDVLFFFRYADNLAAGNGYCFNAGEAPVCGASAPLWPPLIALGELFGLTASSSVVVISVGFTLGATFLLGLLMLRFFGPIGVLTLTPLLTLQHFYSTWGTSGMESPLTFLLIASALTVASGVGRAWQVGTVAGLCLIHKVDLAPLGLALLTGCFVWRRDVAERALLVAVGIAAAWFAFMTWYFGYPLPNSFLTKLGAHDSVSTGWFSNLGLVAGGGLLRSVLAVVGVIALRRHTLVAALAVTQILVPTLAYTLHPPPEKFAWYVAAIAPALGFLAASGMALLLRARPAASVGHVLVSVIPLLPLGVYLAGADTPFVKGWHRYLENYQVPLREAGLWVKENTPPDARVLTSWGNPAYYSDRYVYDWTFLNRKHEEGNLLVKYRPEVWVQMRFGELSEWVPPEPYEIVHSIETTGGQGPLFVAVLFRKEPPPTPPERKRGHAVKALLRELEESGRDGATGPSLQQLRERVRAALAEMSEEKRALVLQRWPALGELLPAESSAPGR